MQGLSDMVAQLAGVLTDVSSTSHARRAAYAEAASAGLSMSTSSSSTTRQGMDTSGYHALRGQLAQRGAVADDPLLEALHDALQAGAALGDATASQPVAGQLVSTGSGSLLNGSGSGDPGSLQAPLTVKALTDGLQALHSSLSAARDQASRMLAGGALPPGVVQAQASAEAAHALLFQPAASAPAPAAASGKEGPAWSLLMRPPELGAAITDLDSLNNQLQVGAW
jgi:hypothetical protein